MYTQAKFDDNGKIIGYIVTRKKPFLKGLEEAKKIMLHCLEILLRIMNFLCVENFIMVIS